MEKNKRIDQYEKLEHLVRRDAREEATKVFKELASQYQINKPQIHYHDGVDLPRLNMKDLIQNEKNLTDLVMSNDSGSPLVDSFEIRNIPNISAIIFLGFAANNADGSPATQRAIVNGYAPFYKVFKLENESGSVIVAGQPPGRPFAQGGNYWYFNSTGSVARVGRSVEQLVYVNNGTSDLALVYIESITTTSIRITYELATNWQVNGAFIQV